MWFVWLAENGAKGLTNSINISLFSNKMVDEFRPKLRLDQRLFCQPKEDAKQTKTFDALEWLAAMCSQIPSRGEQMVR